ncbi:MAG TPA: class I SAM-dependent methyltransferase [Blastocatellia bacterium]
MRKLEQGWDRLQPVHTGLQSGQAEACPTIGNFSGKVAGYAAHRWNYAPAAIEHIVQTAQLTAGSVVADIGAGTGMLGEHFLGRAGRVFAIEPNAEMRQAASFEMLDGRSDATTLPDRSVDLIAVGRAIHWFPPESTKAEFQRILKPGGFLAVLRIPCADENLLAALNAIKTEANGWNRELNEIRKSQPPLEFYFGHGDFERLRFPSFVRECWDEFFGRLCSFAVAPSPAHPGFAAFQQAARDVFDRFRSDEFLTVPLATELFLGRITQDDRGLSLGIYTHDTF